MQRIPRVLQCALIPAAALAVGLFRVSLKLPQSDAVGFPATQKYSDGSVVRWDQAAQPDGGEPGPSRADGDPGRALIRRRT